MEMTLSLCTNCEKAPGCTLSNGHSVLHCEEHQVKNWKPLINGFELNQTNFNTPKPVHNYAGLCSNCEIKDSCSWRNPETVVFHCEHYL